MPPRYVSVLAFIRSKLKVSKTWKTFQLLTYPLSYSSLQEEAATKQLQSYKALVTKKDKEMID